MHPRPSISVIIATGRESYDAYLIDPKLHLMRPSFETLQAQTFTDFEVIVVDSLFKHRNLASEIQSLQAWNFPWKVIGYDSIWLDRGLWSLQHAFNSGAVASRGKYLLFCGDCFRLPTYTLEHSQILIDQGMSPMLMCYRTKGCQLVKGEDITQTIDGCYTIQDAKDRGLFQLGKIYCESRIGALRDGFLPPILFNWQFHFGYGFIWRDDFFSVNGWDEMFDGDKALGDVEMGSRLEMCGRLRACLKWDLCVYEELHKKICQSVFSNEAVFKSNYDMIWLMRLYNISRANSTLYKTCDLQRVVRSQLAGLTGWHLRHGQLTERESFYSQFWIDNQPRFILEDHCAGA